MLVAIYSVLLIAGITAGQLLDVGPFKNTLHFVTSSCLAFIMIEVGLEFSIDRRPFKSYGLDALVAFSAAYLPALMWFVYFLVVVGSPWLAALLGGVSAAPTSAGILFAMLSAAGLQMTWVYRKARVLAVLDDLATILLLIPLEFVLHGFQIQSVAVLVLISFFLFASFRWQNRLVLPTAKPWLLVYAVVLAGLLVLFTWTTHIHIEILIPAFMLGCLLHMPRPHDQVVVETRVPIDIVIKGAFMLLVGLSFPRAVLGNMPFIVTAGHILALLVLSNLGKCLCFLFYRDESTWRERLGLCVAMFPRGEVGAAVLLIAIGYGTDVFTNSLALISLAVNLVLTGVFISWVVALGRGACRSEAGAP